MSETEYEVDENGEVIEPTPDTEEEAAAEAEEEAAPEQEPEPEPEGLSEKEIEAIFKKINTAHAAYTRKVGDAMGDEAVNLLPCPVCGEAVPGFVDKRSVGQFPDEIRRQVMRFLGFATEQDYEPSQAHRVCGSCVGKGKVTTGSAVPSHETITCPACKGYGYVPPPTSERERSRRPGRDRRRSRSA